MNTLSNDVFVIIAPLWENVRSQRREYCLHRRRFRQKIPNINRRNFTAIEEDGVATQPDNNNINNNNNNDNNQNMPLKEIISAISSMNSRKQTEGIIELRKLLSSKFDLSLTQIYAHQLIPILLKWLRDFRNEHLQSVAAWVISKLAENSDTLLDYLMRHNIVHYLISLLYADAVNVIDRGIWALGVIAGRSACARDIIVHQNVFKSILYLARKQNLEFFEYDFVYLIFKLCSHNKPVALLHIRPLLPYLSELLLINDMQVVYISCCTLWYITKDGEANARALLETSAIQNLIDLLESDDHSVLYIALKILGNIIVYGNEIADHFITADGLSKLKMLLKSSDQEIIEESTWIISNITAGSYYQLKAVLDANLFTNIENLLCNGHFESRFEAAWILSNAFVSGHPTLIKQIVDKYSLLGPFCNLLDLTNDLLHMVVLSGILGFLAKFGDQREILYYYKKIYEVDGLKKIVCSTAPQSPTEPCIF